MLRLILMGMFGVMYLLNLYIFASGEHAIYQRYQRWWENNIAPLTSIERDQRDKYKPKLMRFFSIALRPSSVAIIMHILLTLLSEIYYIMTFSTMTALTPTMTPYPAAPITAELLDVVDGDDQQTRQQRHEFAIETNEALHLLFAGYVTYRRITIFNLLLITALPLQSASQSLRFRAFLAALARTVYTSIELYFILFLLTLSVLFLGQHSFGFEEEDFKNFSYTSMTIFKMMIGRLVGVYYQLMVEISLAKAIIFVLPIILMKTIFLTVFLAVVAYEYEHNVLNQDFSSNINLLRSIFFCNISLDKRQ